MYGTTGRCLRVNLSEGRTSIEEIAPELLAQFIGGRGLGVKVLSDEIDPSTDPLGPDNKLIFSSGSLVGTGAVAAASCYVITKSGLSGTIGCAKTRGHFGAELKFAGFDMIIVEGRAESPVILSIMDDRIRIQPGLEFWGRSTSETEELFKKNLTDEWAGHETYLVSIGPAGELLLPEANIVNDGFLSVSGAGIGSVMGSKKLKAVAVKGNHFLSVADGDRFVRVVNTLINRLNSAPLTSRPMAAWGSGFLTDLCWQKGILPQKNFQAPARAVSAGIEIEKLSDTFALRSRGCFACPIACIKKTDVSHPLFRGRGMAPTYLAIGALGLNCGIRDLTTIGMANMLCGELGLDPLGAGGTVATAMELVEKGIASEDNLKLKCRFGHGEDLLEALTRMATEEEHAGRIGRGGQALAEEYGRADCFMGVKGMSLAPFDPRCIQGMGLHFATSNCGPRHYFAPTFIDEVANVHGQMDPWTTDGKAELVKRYQDMAAIMDSLGLCNWPLLGLRFDNFVPMINSCLGTNYSADELLRIGERIWNQEKLFNLKAGFDHRHDTLPERFMRDPVRDELGQEQVSKLDEMRPEYYELRGWTDRGEPRPETLESLGLGP